MKFSHSQKPHNSFTHPRFLNGVGCDDVMIGPAQ